MDRDLENEYMEGWLETWVEILGHGSRHGFEMSSTERKKAGLAGLLAFTTRGLLATN